VSGATASFQITAEGVTTVTFQATDIAGNVGPAHTLTVRIDKTPPTTSISTFLLALGQLQGAATDNLSGVASTTVTLTGTGLSTGNSYTIPATCSGCGPTNPPGPSRTTWTASLSGVQAGTYDATAASIDVAGNQGPSSSAFAITIP
jgi:hypothetical protein